MIYDVYYSDESGEHHRGDAKPGARSFPGRSGVLSLPCHHPAGGERLGMDVYPQSGVLRVLHELPHAGTKETQVTHGRGTGRARNQ